MARKLISPAHPGIYLKEVLQELGLSQYRLAQDIGVPAMRISHVVRGQRPLRGELALRLGRYFRQSPRYWMNLQTDTTWISPKMHLAKESCGKAALRCCGVGRCASREAASTNAEPISQMWRVCLYVGQRTFGR